MLILDNENRYLLVHCNTIHRKFFVHNAYYSNTTSKRSSNVAITLKYVGNCLD